MAGRGSFLWLVAVVGARSYGPFLWLAWQGLVPMAEPRSYGSFLWLARASFLWLGARSYGRGLVPMASRGDKLSSVG
jgi:hypothetical protein